VIALCLPDEVSLAGNSAEVMFDAVVLLLLLGFCCCGRCCQSSLSLDPQPPSAALACCAEAYDASKLSATAADMPNEAS